MSKALRPREPEDRTARVWQPTDFLHAAGVGDAFQPKRWREERGVAFKPTVVEPTDLSAPVPHALELPGMLPAAALPPEPQPQAVAPPPLAEPEDLVSQQAVEDARLEAYAKGLEHGRKEARQQAEEAQKAQQQVLLERIAALQASVAELKQAPERVFEPLKRLALHLAEQLVLGELTQSPQAIERLVQRCVDELRPQLSTPVLVELHPDDLAQLQPWLASQHQEKKSSGEGSAGASAPLPWHLQANEGLRPGSVRASANDAVVSDLIEHRLDTLARQLLVDAARVARQSALQPDRLASRRAEVSEVLDAQPRMSDAPRSSRFAPVMEADVVASTDDVAPDEAFDAPQPDRPAGEDRAE